MPTYRTAATNTFNLDLNSIIEEAFERCGSELHSGYDMRTARRSLNLLLMDWANRGINLWTLDVGQQVLTPGQATYDLPVDTVDLLDHVIRTGTGQNQTDLTINRISASMYSTVPNKNATGRPLQIWVERKTGATDSTGTVQYPQVTVWPVPDSSQTYTLVYWRMRRMQDAGDGPNGQDIPFRMMPALVSGLAYYLAMKVPGAEARLATLKEIYDEQWTLASEEDRDRSPLRFVPRQMYI